MAEKNWLIHREYFYEAHHRYPGIWELFWVDPTGIEHCIMNFCREESAMTLALEDQEWRKRETVLTHTTRAASRLKEKAIEDSYLEFEKDSDQDKKDNQPVEFSNEELSDKEKRRLRRLARKAKKGDKNG